MKRLTEKKKNIVAVVLILAAAALIVTGVVLGQERSVLTKAIRICMECVGIG
ncbi:MAG: thioredoxin [Clostridiales bacterium]|nr:thioredoxin [Clostridiales bacterium]